MYLQSAIMRDALARVTEACDVTSMTSPCTRAASGEMSVHGAIASAVFNTCFTYAPEPLLQIRRTMVYSGHCLTNTGRTHKPQMNESDRDVVMVCRERLDVANTQQRSPRSRLGMPMRLLRIE
jgi:hypothetical protein